MWKLWCKALGEKSSDNNHEADRIAIIRTIIFLKLQDLDLGRMF